MVSELKDHLLRHLQGVEKKKIEQMVLDYVSKLVGFALSSLPDPPPPPNRLVSGCIVPSMWFNRFFILGFLELSHPQTCICGAVD